jgi:NAD-dependent dihydropyrimidine dehydrogenase PreA subunit
MKNSRKIVEIDEERCDGCGNCVISCAEGAIQIIEGKARIVKDSYCDGLGACLGECPQGALRIIEREAEEFDPEAVEHYLEERSKIGQEKTEELKMACGCPSSQIRMFNPGAEAKAPDAPSPVEAGEGSDLSHWPIQIRLVPPNAPFLKRADLLVVADCAPVAYPDFHRRFVKNKAILLGCPKFDDVQEYINKFAAIFKTADIRSVTVIDMEVPCCSALPAIVRKGMQASGREIPVEEIVISVQGDLLKPKEHAA